MRLPTIRINYSGTYPQEAAPNYSWTYPQEAAPDYSGTYPQEAAPDYSGTYPHEAAPDYSWTYPQEAAPNYSGTYPQEAASTIAMQKASVRDVFRKIFPCTKTYNMLCAMWNPPSEVGLVWKEVGLVRKDI